MRTFIPAALAVCAFVASPVSAQQTGLVNVDLGNILSDNDVRVQLQNILNNNLNNNDVAVQIPANVNVPIGVAANICGVSVLSLKTTGTCTATTNISQGHMRALANAIQRSR